MSPERPAVMRGRPLVPGAALGRALVLEHGLSFAMAVDVTSGRITDVHSSHAGESVSGRVLVMSAGRGSSSASTALAEAIRLGTAPAAIVLVEMDEILTVGAVMAARLYGRTCPILMVAEADCMAIRPDAIIDILPDGRISVADPGTPP